MSLQSKVITDYEDFLRLEEPWQDLVSRSHFNNFAVTHSWLRVWWSSFAKDESLRIVVVWDGEKLVAAAPLKLGAGRFRGLPVTELSFLTNLHVPAIDFLVDQERPAALINLLAAIGQIEHWTVFCLQNIPANSLFWPVWENTFQQANFLCFRKKGLSSPTLAIEGDWETYFSSLTKKFRKGLRNKINRLEKSGPVAVEEISRQMSQEYVEENLFRISAKSWKAKYHKDLNSDAALKKFFQELTALAQEKNWLRLWFLKVDGQVVAFEYHLLYNQQDYALRADFDEDYRPLQPGSYLDYQILQQLFALKVTQYNMGGTDDYYKLNWTEKCAEHWYGYIFCPSLYGRFLHWLEFTLIPGLRQSRFLSAGKKQIARLTAKPFRNPKQDENS